MCHFLTISVPANTVPEVPEKFRRTIHFTKHGNRSVTEHIPADWVSFTATSDDCSCDFFRTAPDSSLDISKIEKKYRKKGWSDAKVQRALESPAVIPSRSAGRRDDLLDMVSDLTKAFGEIRLSLHWYSGDVETEKFVLTDAGRVYLADFKRDPSALPDESTITIKGEV